MERTSQLEELESLTAASVEGMKRGGLKPIDWEVYIDSSTNELWVNVWFENGPTLYERRKVALAMLVTDIRKKATTLSGYVNMQFENEVGDNGIAIWWW
ncbi:hypothetical protein PM035_14090 [Halorubrum ezzemoulense]|uniref:hypothetical protein n=1 Tax=Halorubrum ezzemoulense TaxID=337243 RepID=UPI00232DF5BB|nr:hypothetical protein [Halorubrum ezzemoulense]MDB2261936.1 hypothetical protein [Halorubrum ezzemoulense]MDB2268819.1 hypothetical protein [Halorubrum ezzemoulense]